MKNFKFSLTILILGIITTAFFWPTSKKPIKLITMLEVQQNLVSLGYLNKVDEVNGIGKFILKQWSYAELHENEKRRMNNEYQNQKK